MKISVFTNGLVLCAALIVSGCTINGIASSNVSLEGNEAQPSVNKTISISDFNEIEASQGIKIIFTQGSDNRHAKIATTKSAEKYLKVEVYNKTLKAYYANTEGDRGVKIKGPSIIHVSSPELNEIDLSSAANLTIEGDLKVNGKLDIDLSSASSFDAGTIQCRNIDADLSSSASANIGKLMGNLDVDVSSASSFGITSMEGDLNAEASSAASVKINSIRTSVISAVASSASTISIDGISGGDIKSSASSGAKIKLSGKADSLKKEASSGGSVSSSDLSITQ